VAVDGVCGIGVNDDLSAVRPDPFTPVRAQICGYIDRQGCRSAEPDIRVIVRVNSRIVGRLREVYAADKGAPRCAAIGNASPVPAAFRDEGDHVAGRRQDISPARKNEARRVVGQRQSTVKGDDAQNARRLCAEAGDRGRAGDVDIPAGCRADVCSRCRWNVRALGGQVIGACYGRNPARAACGDRTREVAVRHPVIDEGIVLGRFDDCIWGSERPGWR
jgi:hypothetical protein